NLDVATIYKRLQDSHLRIVQNCRVAIRRRTADQDVVPFPSSLGEEIGLLIADRGSVNPNKESDVRVADQALVTDQRHLPGLRSADDAHGFVGVVRYENQSFDPGSQELVGLFEL